MKQSLNEEFYRMQKLAGIINESQLNEKNTNFEFNCSFFKFNSFGKSSIFSNFKMSLVD